MSRTIRIDADVERVVLANQREGETKQATLGRLVKDRISVTTEPEPLVDVLIEALHQQFGGDFCDHEDGAACKENAADMVADYGDRIRPGSP